MYRNLTRMRGSGLAIKNYLTVPQLRKKALNSISAVQDTYYSTKDIFERHKVVFTICTSIASVATAWAGYTLRHIHQSRIDQRLESIENAVKNKYQMEKHELKNLVSGGISLSACVATAGTSLIIGYGLGWRGGAWYINRKFRREQMKLLGLLKPRRWPLKFLKRPSRHRQHENGVKTSSFPEPLHKEPYVAAGGTNQQSSWLKVRTCPLKFLRRPLLPPKLHGNGLKTSQQPLQNEPNVAAGETQQASSLVHGGK